MGTEEGRGGRGDKISFAFGRAGRNFGLKKGSLLILTNHRPPPPLSFLFHTIFSSGDQLEEIGHFPAFMAHPRPTPPAADISSAGRASRRRHVVAADQQISEK